MAFPINHKGHPVASFTGLKFFSAKYTCTTSMIWFAYVVCRYTKRKTNSGIVVALKNKDRVVGQTFRFECPPGSSGTGIRFFSNVSVFTACKTYFLHFPCGKRNGQERKIVSEVKKGCPFFAGQTTTGVVKGRNPHYRRAGNNKAGAARPLIAYEGVQAMMKEPPDMSGTGRATLFLPPCLSAGSPKSQLPRFFCATAVIFRSPEVSLRKPLVYPVRTLPFSWRPQ